MPLNMTSREQTLIAELLISVRSYVYAYQTGRDNHQVLVESVQDWQARYQIKPNELSTIFDKMHRSGANA